MTRTTSGSPTLGTPAMAALPMAMVATFGFDTNISTSVGWASVRTGARSCASGWRVTSTCTVSPAPTRISCSADRYPSRRTRSVSGPVGTRSRMKRPSTPAVAPSAVPTTETVAPWAGAAAPVSTRAVTRPATTPVAGTLRSEECGNEADQDATRAEANDGYGPTLGPGWRNRHDGSLSFVVITVDLAPR